MNLKKFFNKKYLSPHHWLLFLRRQPKHLQHVYSLSIAGIITLIVAVIILYVDYGFWRERYLSDEILEAKKIEEMNAESPKEMITRFFGEAKSQLEAIDASRKELLQGKEIYKEGE